MGYIVKWQLPTRGAVWVSNHAKAMSMKADLLRSGVPEVSIEEVNDNTGELIESRA